MPRGRLVLASNECIGTASGQAKIGNLGLPDAGVCVAKTVISLAKQASSRRVRKPQGRAGSGFLFFQRRFLPSASSEIISSSLVSMWWNILQNFSKWVGNGEREWMCRNLGRVLRSLIGKARFSLGRYLVAPPELPVVLVFSRYSRGTPKKGAPHTPAARRLRPLSH
jgi:hypothetical protein